MAVAVADGWWWLPAACPALRGVVSVVGVDALLVLLVLSFVLGGTAGTGPPTWERGSCGVALSVFASAPLAESADSGKESGGRRGVVPFKFGAHEFCEFVVV